MNVCQKASENRKKPSNIAKKPPKAVGITKNNISNNSSKPVKNPWKKRQKHVKIPERPLKMSKIRQTIKNRRKPSNNVQQLYETIKKLCKISEKPIKSIKNGQKCVSNRQNIQKLAENRQKPSKRVKNTLKTSTNRQKTSKHRRKPSKST